MELCFLCLLGIIGNMKTFVIILAATLTMCSRSSPSIAGDSHEANFAKQISGILRECEQIKPGMTRAELLKVFTTEGGFYTTANRTFVYRGCQYIKVDVDFSLSDPKPGGLEERPTDTISKISKPYLGWGIGD
jgi:hypothetical protein